MSSLTVEIAKNNRLKKAPLAKKHSSFNTWFKVETHSDTLELSDVHPVQWDPGSEVLFWFLLIGSGSLQQGGIEAAWELEYLIAFCGASCHTCANTIPRDFNRTDYRSSRKKLTLNISKCVCCLIFSQLLILYYQYFLLRLSKQKQWVDCPGVGYPMFQTTAYENLIVDSQQHKSLWVSKPKQPSSTMPMSNSVEEIFSSSHEHQKSKKCWNWWVE